MIRAGTLARAAAACCLLLLAACVTRTVEAASEMAGMGPMLSVERFLQAANVRDFQAMRRLFGMYDGPIRGDRLELEIRMAAIADVLRHEDYAIASEQMEPGREYPTTRVLVTLTQGGRQIAGVPFLVVRTEGGGWLVQQVDLEYLMRG